MSIKSDLDFDFTEPQKTAFHDSLDAILDNLSDPSVVYVNLTKEERKLPSIGNKRMPYVHDAVSNVLPVFPALASDSITLERTIRLLGLIGFIKAITPKLKEINDRFTDLELNAENIVYISMNDSYDKAQRQEGRMPGADVLIEAIAPLFENQGKKGSGPQPAPGDVNTGDNSTGPTPRPPSDGNGDATPSNS